MTINCERTLPQNVFQRTLTKCLPLSVMICLLWGPVGWKSVQEAWQEAHRANAIVILYNMATWGDSNVSIRLCNP